MMRPWLVWTLVAIICWGFWAVLGRLTSLSAALLQVLSTAGILPVLILLALSGRLTATGNRRQGVALAFASGLVTCFGNIAYYDVLNRGEKAATVVPLTALYPLVTVVLALIFLKEKLNAWQRLGIAFSLMAIWLFNVPSAKGLVSPWLTAALIPIVFWGVAGLLQKLATNQISGELSTLWFLSAFIPVAIVLWLRDPMSWSAVAEHTAVAVAVGLTFALGNFALLCAFAKEGKASVIAPLAGLYPLISIPIAIIGLQERIGARESAGIGIALLSVVALSRESAGQPNPAPAKAAVKNEIHP
jgi:uncharacterized membrane protein